MIELSLELFVGAICGFGLGVWLGSRRLFKAARHIQEYLKGKRDLQDLRFGRATDPLHQALKPIAEEQERVSILEDEVRRVTRIATLLDEIPDALIVVDADQVIQFTNRAFQKLFCEIEARPGGGLLETFRDHRYVVAIEGVLETQEPAESTISRENPTGEPVIHRLRISPLPDSNEGCWMLISDITDEVTTEQVRQDFFANASHELRTPLTLINGYVETLQDGLADNPEVLEKSLGVMAKHGDRLARLVDDMLTISRLEGPYQNLNLKEFLLVECANDIVGSLSNIIANKQADVVVAGPEDGGLYLGDRFYWDQILLNLIENAIKENQRSGLKIVIAIQPTEDGYQISVKDDGVGIASSDLPFVFKRFYRAEKHHSNNRVKGTGLGLSIIKRAVEAHGGTIDLFSEPGSKTIFTIHVPNAQPTLSDKS